MEVQILKEIKKEIVKKNSTLIASSCPKGNYRKNIEKKGIWVNFRGWQDRDYTPSMEYLDFKRQVSIKLKDTYLKSINKVLDIPNGLRLMRICNFQPFISNNLTPSKDIKLTIKQRK